MEIVSERTGARPAYRLRAKPKESYGERPKRVTDERIIDRTTAVERSRAEMLDAVYKKTTVRLKFHYTNVSVGDIVVISAPRYNIPANAANNRFIVTSVQSVTDATSTYNIVKAVRSD